MPLTVIRIPLNITRSMPLNNTRSMPLNITRPMSLNVITSMPLTITRSIMPLTVNKHIDTLLLLQCRSPLGGQCHVTFCVRIHPDNRMSIARNLRTNLIRHSGSILEVPWGFCMRVDFWSGRLVSGLDSPLTAPLPAQKNKLSYQYPANSDSLVLH
jgi:hypothetical protein